MMPATRRRIAAASGALALVAASVFAGSALAASAAPPVITINGGPTFYEETAGYIDFGIDGTLTDAAIAQTRVTATILDLDKEREKVTLKMADGSVATVKVQNPANLDKVRVGDTILIRYLEAVDITVKGK